MPYNVQMSHTPIIYTIIQQSASHAPFGWSFSGWQESMAVSLQKQQKNLQYTKTSTTIKKISQHVMSEQSSSLQGFCRIQHC